LRSFHDLGGPATSVIHPHINGLCLIFWIVKSAFASSDALKSDTSEGMDNDGQKDLNCR
jgi:hypothetical protein